MKTKLPEGQFLTNFLWRNLPPASPRTVALLKRLSTLSILVAIVLLCARTFPQIARGIVGLNVYATAVILFDADIIIGFILVFLAKFHERRNFIDALILKGASFHEAKLVWDQRTKPSADRSLAGD